MGFRVSDLVFARGVHSLKPVMFFTLSLSSIQSKGHRGRVCGNSVDGGSHVSMLDDEEGAPTSGARVSRLCEQQTQRTMRCVVKDPSAKTSQNRKQQVEHVLQLCSRYLESLGRCCGCLKQRCTF